MGVPRMTDLSPISNVAYLRDGHITHDGDALYIALMVAASRNEELQKLQRGRSRRREKVDSKT